eukprot:TRINITY_DN4551_c0_g1_i2.p1 TRINITY_DN4551_c0_g1~~TRINITY_DN4551_c0_g1_i2.p1  ORF type:complete len:306 (+),score=68.54 TRINITY_DN4551_c0_g1_i2:34-918(+)
MAQLQNKSSTDLKLSPIQHFEELSIRFVDGKLEVLDQTKLPHEMIWVHVEDVERMWHLIKNLSVRGAPLIGVAAALSLAVAATKGKTREEVIESAKYLITSRPTAVNLMFCCNRIIDELTRTKDQDHVQQTCNLACEMLNKEVTMNQSMATYGASLVQDGEGILTHCNTGGLATPGKGTALGVIKEAWTQGKKIHVYVDETRPLLQGGRLTTYELERAGIPYTLICDSMAAVLMRQGKIQRVFVGADRIATNGDFANKIGTYSVAVAAHHHNIPFHVVAPVSTVDLHCPGGSSS